MLFLWTCGYSCYMLSVHFSVCFQIPCMCDRETGKERERERDTEKMRPLSSSPRLPVPQLFSSLLFDFLCLYIRVLWRQTQTQHSHMTPFRQTLHKNIQISECPRTVTLLGTPGSTHTYCIQIVFFHCPTHLNTMTHSPISPPSWLYIALRESGLWLWWQDVRRRSSCMTCDLPRKSYLETVDHCNAINHFLYPSKMCINLKNKTV